MRLPEAALYYTIIKTIIENIKIYGNTSGVGDLVEDSTNSNYGKYRVQIKVSNEDGTDEQIKNIYLTSQLQKTDTYVDYINYEKKRVVRLQIENKTETILETLNLEGAINIYEDYTKIEILTQVSPSKIEVKYEGYTFE